LTDDVEQRALILESIGRALLGLRMFTAAERCFGIIIQRQTTLPVRSRARAAHALTAALEGNAAAFRERRIALFNDDAEWGPDPRVAAHVQIDLAHGCQVAGDLDFAREHLRDAITIVRRHGYTSLLERAETILSALEKNTDVQLHPVHPSSELAQHIAAQIEVAELPAPATSG
jgi:hypothetical protein